MKLTSNFFFKVPKMAMSLGTTEECSMGTRAFDNLKPKQIINYLEAQPD